MGLIRHSIQEHFQEDRKAPWWPHLMKLPTSSGLNCNQNTILLSPWETAIKILLISWQNCCWMLCVVSWIVAPHQMLHASWSPGIYMNMNLLGNNFFANAVKLKISRWDQPGLRVGPKSNDWCPQKRKERQFWDTEGKTMQRPRDQRHTGRRPSEDGSSDLSDVSPSHRTPRTACSHQKLGERLGFSLKPSRRNQSGCHFDFGL